MMAFILYKKLVDACINIAPISEIKEIIPDMVEIVKNFNVKYLKVAFITKHTRYWLQKNFGDNALPIYDTIMATNVMRKKGLDIEHLEEYWEVMVDKAHCQEVSLVKLERQLFEYFYDK